jgi:short-subunit dehydrogenase
MAIFWTNASLLLHVLVYALYCLFGGAPSLTTALYAGISHVFLQTSMSLILECDAATYLSPSLSSTTFKGKVVWVTGASSGIGKELCLQLASRGCRSLIISSRREKALRELQKQLQSSYATLNMQVYVVPLDLEKVPDLTDEALLQLLTAADPCQAALDSVDILINNGGISQRSTAKVAPFDVDKKLLYVDFLSYVRLAKFVLPNMRKRQSGTIVNVSSVAGKIGVGLRTGYCGAKHAIQGYFDALRLEELAAESGVGVVTLVPGSVQTNVSKNSVTTDSKTQFGKTDPNIGNGLNVSFAVTCMLKSIANDVDETWIARSKEMFILYLHLYAPQLAKTVMKIATKQLMQDTLG